MCVCVSFAIGFLFLAGFLDYRYRLPPARGCTRSSTEKEVNFFTMLLNVQGSHPCLLIVSYFIFEQWVVEVQCIVWVLY